MKAIKLAEPRQVDCVELEKPVPGPGQALIRIKTAGICGSDIGAFRGTNKLVSSWIRIFTAEHVIPAALAAPTAAPA